MIDANVAQDSIEWAKVMGRETTIDRGDLTTIQWAGLEDGRVIVHWRDGHRSAFHSVWLRHSRYFPAFPDRAAGSERFVRPDRPADIAPATVEVTDGGDLRVIWSPGGGDATDFGAAWLRRHCYSSTERAQRRRPVIHWDGSLAGSPPGLSYLRLHDSDAGRLELYRQVLDYGFTFLHDVPVRSGAVVEVGALFGLVRPSPYGDATSDIRVENIRVDPHLSVGTTMCDFQGPHTDTCWRQSLSGLVFMHCLKAHESGGESLLVDGFTVSERLRAADPEAFELLSTVRINYGSSVDNGDEWRAFGRVITCDADGNVVGFRFRDGSISQLDLPEHLIEPVYAALRSLEAVLYDPTLRLCRKLAPGDAIVIDNQRVLHGRSYFDPTVCERHMQHCSVDRDVFHNNYRRLARALGEDDWNQVLPWGVC